MKNLRFIWVLWPSFVVAAVGNAVFFTAFDPHDLVVFGEPVHAGRIAVYSIGFFSLWALTIASNLLTYFLQKSATEVNRCPYDPDQRPAGCPDGDEGRFE
jgi:hypothetical protein